MSLNPAFYQPSKSISDRLFEAEFNDTVLDQPYWKNPRYDGCKVVSKEINKFTPLLTASNAETGINFATIVRIGAGVGDMRIGGSGQTRFTVGGFFSFIPIGIGHSGIVSADGTSNGFIIENYSNPANSIGSNTSLYLNQPGVFKVGNFIPNITWPGDTINPAGLNPNIKNQTTALYISNTVIGGTEDPQFATIKNHSYVNINQILLIDPITDETQIIDKQAEDFVPFHSFITNDLPTQGSFTIKLIDESIANNLKGPNQYKVKMNKGYLLKSFDFDMDFGSEQLTENNSMYLYRGGKTQRDYVVEGIEITPSVASITNDNRVRFKYGVIETIVGESPFSSYGPGQGHIFARDRMGPSFGSASIIANKFTNKYYSGSFGFINEPAQPGISLTNTDILESSGFGSASRFIGISSLDFLVANNSDDTISFQEKTELHLTLFDGTKDFGNGSNDEKSISTFEIDSNQSPITRGDQCNAFLPKDHELFLKGFNDARFTPQTSTFTDDIINAQLTSSVVAGGCVSVGSHDPAVGPVITLQRGINVDKINDCDVFVQGGFLGQVGYRNIQTSSIYDPTGIGLKGESISGSMIGDNYYSGSFSYQLSWLDKDHTLITNIDKNAELMNGIGSKGILIIPEKTHPKIKNNIQFYLQQAGIIDSSPNTQLQVSNDAY
tara:strand:- start:1769 stop:3769 length:2001 start_codon:yes stop_codon:yes gene_type:complete